MKVATSSFYDRNATALQMLQSQADTLNTQISSGKKLAAASDNPVAYQTLRGIATDTANDTAYSGNLTLAGSLLTQTDSTLGSITTQLQQASSLVVQARNGTQTADTRKIIGQQLAAIADSIAAIANGKDARGQPIFGDANGGAAVTKNADGSYSYATTTGSAIPVADGQSVQTGDSASRVLTFGGKDTLTVLSTLAASLQAGTASDSDMGGAITDLQSAGTQVTDVQASVGARGAHVELMQSMLTTASTNREALRSGLEDTDVTAAITQLQKTMTILSATQASFTKLSSLSLFDYLK